MIPLNENTPRKPLLPALQLGWAALTTFAQGADNDWGPFVGPWILMTSQPMVTQI